MLLWWYKRNRIQLNAEHESYWSSFLSYFLVQVINAISCGFRSRNWTEHHVTVQYFHREICKKKVYVYYVSFYPLMMCKMQTTRSSNDMVHRVLSLSLSIFTFHWKWFGNANKIFGYSFDTSLFKINVNSDDLIRFKSASVAQLTNPFDGHLHDINKGDCFVSRTKSWIFIQFLAFFADDLIRLTFHALGLKSASDWWCQWKHLTKNSQQK